MSARGRWIRAPRGRHQCCLPSFGDKGAWWRCDDCGTTWEVLSTWGPNEPCDPGQVTGCRSARSDRALWVEVGTVRRLLAGVR